MICSIGSDAVLPVMTLVFGVLSPQTHCFQIMIRLLTVSDQAPLLPNSLILQPTRQVGRHLGLRSIISRLPVPIHTFNALPLIIYRLYFVYLFIAKAALSYVSMVSFSMITTRVTSSLRRRYLRAVLNHETTFHETVLSSGTVSLALSTHCNTIQSGLSDKFGLSLQCISTTAAAFIVAFTAQWKLTLVTATIVPAIVLVVGITAVFDSKLEDAINTTNADAASVAEEMLSTIRSVRALNATAKLLQKYQSFLKRSTILGWKRSPVAGTQVGTYMFLLYSAYALAFWYGVHLFTRHEVDTSGEVITTLFSIIIGTNAFSQLTGYLGPFMRISTAGGQLFRIIDHKSERAESSNGAPGHHDGADSLKAMRLTVSIKMTSSSVTFASAILCVLVFWHSTTSVLNIQSGKMTALVGPSGSGKSTIVSLLERWYDSTEGDIMIGDRSIDCIPVAMLRFRIGLV